jgi:phosphatidylglycerophosphate synthase
VLASGGRFWVAALLFPVGGVCDALDGYYARRAREGVARLGAVIDSLCDKLGEAGLALGLFLAVQSNAARFALMVAYVLGTLTSYAKATAGEHGLPIVWHESRRFGRAGRVVILSLTLIVATLAGGDHETAVFMGLIALAGFNFATFAWRVSRILREAA